MQDVCIHRKSFHLRYHDYIAACTSTQVVFYFLCFPVFRKAENVLCCVYVLCLDVVLSHIECHGTDDDQAFYDKGHLVIHAHHDHAVVDNTHDQNTGGNA